MVTSEQRFALEEMLVKMRAGRMKRRTFLEQALALGFTSSAAGSLLAACGGSADSSGGNGASINIVWRSELEPTGVYQKLVDHFNRTNNSGIHVTYVQSPIDSARLHALYLNMLNVRSAAIDIISMDIIWPAEFALNQWVVPIGDKWPHRQRTDYLAPPINGCTLGGQIWAAPLRTDAGLIYYRKDLVPNPPQTWGEFTTMARQVQAEKDIKYGHVWQGAQNEGLVCAFVEVLHGYGGAVLDKNDPKIVTVNSPEALDALTLMVDWVKTISPIALTTKKPDDARAIWEQGDAVFMRNWPNAYNLSNAPTSKVAGKFAVHSMPYAGINTIGHSTIGGWQLGINAFSSPNRIEASWAFIQYMLGPEAQKTLAFAGMASTLSKIYKDKEVLAKNPLFRQLGPILNDARSRPVSPRYPDLTTAIQTRVFQALAQQKTPKEALAALQNDLQLIVNL